MSKQLPVTIGEKFTKDGVEYEITGYALKADKDGQVEMVYFIDTREDSRAMHNSERMYLKPFLETFGAKLPSRIQMIQDLQRENELTQQSVQAQAQLYGVL
ncbi:MAG: hypothetical protein IJZ68_09500 [Bacteroidaceae bacterium]|nr:hypothetical protein [Bacteroidaceae bacterium]